MKKLNNKGFTLVELLAVIIILAIVVGISIPAVLTTTTKAKESAFKSAANSVATWVDSQYQIIQSGLDGTGLATLDPNFSNTNACGATASNCTATSGKSLSTTASGAAGTAAKAFITAAGLKADNIASVTVKINAATGRSCVTLVAKAGGEYAGLANVSGGAC